MFDFSGEERWLLFQHHIASVSKMIPVNRTCSLVVPFGEIEAGNAYQMPKEMNKLAHEEALKFGRCGSWPASYDKGGRVDNSRTSSPHERGTPT